MLKLSAFVLAQDALATDIRQDLATVLDGIAGASKAIMNTLSQPASFNLSRTSKRRNVFGEVVKPLDLFANNELLKRCKTGNKISLMASEENEKPLLLSSDPDTRFVVTFDPLDGSSNIGTGIPVGTIFGIYERLPNLALDDVANFQRSGRALICSGYIIYGYNTVMVMSMGNGTHSFLLNPGDFEFRQVSQMIRFGSGKTYSINEAYYETFSKPIQDWLLSTKSEPGYSARYIGTLVADFHRNLLQGGVFVYPDTQKNPEGKLRLTYECIPMAFLAEQAGGKAINTRGEAILDIVPEHVHQCSSFIVGDAAAVEKIGQFVTSPSNG